MTPYCQAENVTDLILAEVATAAEGLNPDLVGRTIEAVTAEVQSLLAVRYQQPFDPVPAIVRWIVSAISAWRVVGAITSLMDSEGQTDNQWLPIQKQYDKAWTLLLEIAAGKFKLSMGPDGQDLDRENPAIAVNAPPPYFDLSRY